MAYLLNEKVTSTIVMYMVLKRIIRKWTEWEAYKNGIIDKNGKRLRRPKNSKEREGWDILDRFCWSIKRLCTKYLGDSNFAYLFSTVYLMKEDIAVIFNSNKEKYLVELEDLTALKQLQLYKCIKEMESNNILRESNLDLETNVIKILSKAKPIIDKYLLEDEGTALGDIATFTKPLLPQVQRRRFTYKKRKALQLKLKGNNNG